MMRSMLTAAALALCAALPATASAQDFGGLRLRKQASVVDRLESFDRSGCRLSHTSVTVGINRAFAPDSAARQQIGTDGSGGCRPLVSTQVTAGLNMALGSRSVAEQSIFSRQPKGLLASTDVARGVNIAAGKRSAALQQIQSGR